MERKVEFFVHNLTEEDMAEAGAVLRSVILTTGPVTARLEKSLAEFLELPEAVGLTSCTGAMHLALIRNGVGPGDEVITTPMTFAATATAVLQAGAKPVFVDVSPRTGMIEPDAVAAAVTPKTRAILPVHLYGRMADMKGLSEVAEKYGLALVEDAAHCLEGRRDGIRPGQASQAACFSFYPTKSMTCGEGGALGCRDSEDAEWYRSARHHGITKNAAERYSKKYRHWDLTFFGWKYNMDDVKAALLIHQIERLEAARKKRQELEELYRNLLADVPGLDFIEPPGPGEISGHHLFTVLVPRGMERDRVLTELQERGVGCAVNYRAVHTLTFFQETLGLKPEDYPVALEMGERTVSLPLYPKLRHDQVEFTCDQLTSLLGL